MAARVAAVGPHRGDRRADKPLLLGLVLRDLHRAPVRVACHDRRALERALPLRRAEVDAETAEDDGERPRGGRGRVMRQDEPGWLSADQAGARVGMTGEWVRRQIVAGRLRATVYTTGRRRTYRIRLDDWKAFLSDFSRGTDRPCQI